VAGGLIWVAIVLWRRGKGHSTRPEGPESEPTRDATPPQGEPPTA
jgi:hypothetical protein